MIELAYIATAFVAPPGSETLWLPMRAMVENLNADHMLPLLKKYDLVDKKPEEWVSNQVLADLYKDMMDRKENFIEDMTAFGVAGVDTLPFSPEITTIEAAISYIQVISVGATRKVPKDYGFPAEKIGTGHMLVYNNTANPPFSMVGLCWGLCKRFRKDDEIFSVSISPQKYKGLDVIDVRWGTPEEMGQV